MRFSACFLSAVAVVLLLGGAAWGQVLTYQVTGTVDTQASKIDLPVYVPLPTTISGTLVYDTANGDTDAAAAHGLYHLESLTLTMGAYTITAAAGEGMFDVAVSPLSYLAYTDNASTFIPEAGQINGIQVELLDLAKSSDGTGDQFPLAFGDIADFDVRCAFSIKYTNAGMGADIDVVGTIDAITVPEPATILLLGTAAMFLRRRYR